MRVSRRPISRRPSSGTARSRVPISPARNFGECVVHASRTHGCRVSRRQQLQQADLCGVDFTGADPDAANLDEDPLRRAHALAEGVHAARRDDLEGNGPLSRGPRPRAVGAADRQARHRPVHETSRRADRCRQAVEGPQDAEGRALPPLRPDGGRSFRRRRQEPGDPDLSSTRAGSTPTGPTPAARRISTSAAASAARSASICSS